MTGSIIINETDIAGYGAFIVRDGDYGFLPFPDRLIPAQNNWYEHDGIDADLSEIYFNARSFPVDFYLSAKSSLEYEFNVNSFYKLISSGYIDLYTREFARTFRLRYLSMPEYAHKGGFYKHGAKRGLFNVNFSMDEPLQLFTRPEIVLPNSSKQYAPSGILVNGTDLARFGVIVNECYSSMLALPAVKSPLVRNFTKRTGVLAYPSSSPRFEAKENIIKCTMAAPSREEFYYNYEALFNNLCKTGEIMVSTYLGEAACYYMKMENFKKHGVFSRGVMVSFTLRLMQINTGLTVFVLSTQDNNTVSTQAGNTLIQMN